MSKPLPRYFDLAVGLDQLDDASLRRAVARELKLPETQLPAVDIRKRSIDARGGRVRFQLTVELDASQWEQPVCRALVESRPSPVVIVGNGPAGLFCAYELARHGVAATVVDRGKPVQPRRRDLKLLNRGGVVDPDSNYCFGEGGAGTYSDGKLYTRAHKRGDVRDVLEVLVRHGAPQEILVDARPHIGSNRLPKVVDAMRVALESVGVQFLFGRRVTGLLSAERAGVRTLRGVSCREEEIPGRCVVIATGHSARDVYEFLHAAQVPLVAKEFALGVRVEHPQPFVNQAQYGRYAGHPALAAASYRLAHTEGENRVFSFCMCPGGWIVPAATEPGALVVNGMSLSRRDSPHANSGIVVGVSPTELARAGFAEHPLMGIEFQARIERAAFDAGGGDLRAPAQRVTDFVQGRPSADLPSTSYIPGIQPASLDAVLDAGGLPLAARLRRGLSRFEQKMPGFVSEAGVLVGVESRTSSPVRVLRDADTLECPNLAGMFPCGEGAGYAGGIMSAAMDGIRVARKVLSQLSSEASL